MYLVLVSLCILFYSVYVFSFSQFMYLVLFSLCIFTFLSVGEKPPLQYTFPFMLFWFNVVMACINGRNILYKINEWIVSEALCSF